MKRITIGRYSDDTSIKPTPPRSIGTSNGVTMSEDFTYGGWIEGVTNNDEQWILFIDKDGRPSIFWPQRDTDGAVIGEGINLQDVRIRKFLEIMSDPDPRTRATRLKHAAEAALKAIDSEGLPEGGGASGR